MSSTVGCQTPQTSDKVLGAVEVRDVQIKGPWPTEQPKIIYVSDFSLDVEHFEGEHGLGSVLPGRRLKRIDQILPHPMVNSGPELQAEKIVAEMSRSLVNCLQDKGFSAQRIPNVNSIPLPRDGWLLQGVFTEVDEGNRLKRATIGFGQGATRMDIQVSISDLTETNPTEPFLVFGTVKDPNKIPGAIVTMNPYVALAKFVIEKNATEKDIKKTAEQIVSEIIKESEQLKK